MDIEDQNLLESGGLDVDQESSAHLLTTSKWTRFIAILFFVACALAILLLFTGGMRSFGNLSRLSNIPLFGMEETGIFLVIAFIFIAMYFVTYFFLFRFSNFTREALVSENTETLNKGLKSLKTYFILSASLAALLLLFTLVFVFNLF